MELITTTIFSLLLSISAPAKAPPAKAATPCCAQPCKQCCDPCPLCPEWLCRLLGCCN